MIRVVLGALRARGAQTLTVLVLAVLAVAAATAAPWYVLAADDAALVNDVLTAPAADRVISAERNQDLDRAPAELLATFRADVAQAIDLPGEDTYLGMAQAGRYQRGTVSVSVPVNYRDGICDHVALTGRCPSAPGDALVTRRSAELTDVRIGDTLPVRPGNSGPTVTLRVVGIYDPIDPSGPYWADTLYEPPSDSTAAAARTDPVFVPLATFTPGGLNAPQIVEDVVLPLAAFQGSDLADRINHAQFVLSQNGMQINVKAGDILDRIVQDQQLINVGVLVGAAQLLVLGWFALFLAGRFTAADRRRDVALLKLRGTTFGRLLRLVVGQSTAPVLAGTVLGVGLGYLLARLTAGSVTGPGRATLAWELSAGAVLLAVAGALLASIASEWRILRAPVAELLRQVPARRPSRGSGGGHDVRRPHWRAGVADLAVVVLAVAGAYQVRAQGGADGSVPGLALLAPGLVALAVALLLARALSYLAGRAGVVALRTGRLRLGLGALQVARRPGTERVFALLAVAVAVLGTAAMGWQASTQARQSRAALEVGADQQLTVRAASRQQLVSAVRAADPTGRYAMAVVSNTSTVQGSPPVLAVDASRLAQVATWQSGYGKSPAALAAELRPPAPAPLLFAGTGVTLDATLASAAPVGVVLLNLVNVSTGDSVQVVFGPLKAGRHTYQAASAGCAAGGCRLDSLRLCGPLNQVGVYPPAAPGASATLNGIGQRGPDVPVAGASVLGDVRRWHGPLAARPSAPVLTAAAGGLTVAIPAGGPPDPPGSASLDLIYPVDAPLPLPGVVVGAVPAAWQVGDPTLSPFGVDAVPVRVVDTVPALPALGAGGVLIDLDSADRTVTSAAVGDSQQVWLARGAPRSIVGTLRAKGLTILRTDSMAADLSGLGTQGLTAALRFALLTAIVGVLLGAAAVTVAGAVEREPRAVELSALRTQGLTGTAARAIGYGGYASLVGAAVLAGVVGAVLARFLAGSGLPIFADRWAVVPVPSGLRPLPLVLSAVGAAVLLGAAGLAAGYQLNRAVRAGGPETAGPRIVRQGAAEARRDGERSEVAR
ncbi:MAG TPA: ABC transporter permease [Rugosimonospora sp.]